MSGGPAGCARLAAGRTRVSHVPCRHRCEYRHYRGSRGRADRQLRGEGTAAVSRLSHAHSTSGGVSTLRNMKTRTAGVRTHLSPAGSCYSRERRGTDGDEQGTRSARGTVPGSSQGRVQATAAARRRVPRSRGWRGVVRRPGRGVPAPADIWERHRGRPADAHRWDGLLRRGHVPCPAPLLRNLPGPSGQIGRASPLRWNPAHLPAGPLGSTCLAPASLRSGGKIKIKKEK